MPVVSSARWLIMRRPVNKGYSINFVVDLRTINLSFLN